MSFIDNFEQTLNDFFFRYHPRQIKKIPQIISEFKGKEKEVMLLLCKTYKVSPDSIEGLNAYNPNPVVAPVVDDKAIEEVPASESSDEETAENAEDSSNDDAPVEEKK